MRWELMHYQIIKYYLILRLKKNEGREIREFEEDDANIWSILFW